MKRVLICALLAACSNDPSKVEQVYQMELPQCSTIYIGGCPHLWCDRNPNWNSAIGGLSPMSKTCEPTSADVSRFPVSR
jgi:hypothetical protein